MSDHEPTPLPTEADLARLNDALDAVVDGRTARVPGTLAADDGWLAAFAAVRHAVRHDEPADLGTRRDAAVAAALAVFDAEHAVQGGVAPVDAHRDDHLTTPDDEPDGTADLVQPLRWRRLGPLAAAAALLVVVGTVVSLQGRSSDMDSSAGEASITTEPGGSMTAKAVADTSADAIQNGAPGPTIDSIEGPAVAAPTIDTPAQLLDLARAYDRAGSADTTAPGAAVAAVTREIPGYGCPLGPDQVVLAEVLWQGALGVAVYDTANGTVSVVDPTCATLTSVAP
jgi:hypothetical protein